MDTLIYLIIIGVVIIFLRKIWGSKGKRVQNAINLEEQGRYLDALEIYSKISIRQAADMVMRTPEASQILALRSMERKFTPRNIERAFLNLARIYGAKNDPHKSSKAYIFARKPFAAAKVYIDIGGTDFIPAAIQVIDQNSQFIHDRDQAIRNLARHAYSNQKFIEASELLRAMGAEEEANTVLIAAASELKKQGFDSLAKEYLSTTSHPKKALNRYIRDIQKSFASGDIEQVRRSLSITNGLLSTLTEENEGETENENQKIRERIQEFDRRLKVLDSARDLLRKKNLNQSVALYEELVESFGDEVPGFVYAEAALANEEHNPTYSASLYRQAAELVKSKQAAKSFQVRAKNIEAVLSGGSTSLSAESVYPTDQRVEENCSVCRTKVTDITRLVRCPECGSPAHYSHLAEWLKIRGFCPICKKKIKIKNPKRKF
ncbi:hypothetical protein CEE45_00580 [Candidatus Heimdallarchaeota archaeon B3_Heim]|nr:MAG: hypothetical protein CEE45_00580 [Candidatus Heimdallarchaeota archaeon B3_Heim]